MFGQRLRFFALGEAQPTLFKDDESENTMKLLRVNQKFLDVLRSEIAESLFEGNANYKTDDVLNLSKSRGWQGGSPPNWMANKSGQTSL